VDDDGDGLADFDPTPGLGDPDCAAPGDRFEVVIEPGDLLAIGLDAGAILHFDRSASALSKVYESESGDPPVKGEMVGSGLFYFSEGDRIRRLDLVTGGVDTVSEGGLLQFPDGLARDRDGRLVVVDQGSPARLLRIDPAQGTQELVYEGGVLASPRDVVLDQNGDYLVSNESGLPDVVRILRDGSSAATLLNLGSGVTGLAFDGQQTLYAGVLVPGLEGVFTLDTVSGSFNPFSLLSPGQRPRDVDLDLDGDLVVNEETTSSILEIDVPSGAVSTLVTDPSLSTPRGVAVVPQSQCSDGVDQDGDALVDLADPDCSGTLDDSEWSLAPGDIVVADAGASNLVRVDPAAGTPTVLLSNPDVLWAKGVHLDAGGDILFTDFQFGDDQAPALYRLETDRGRLERISSGGLFDGPRGIDLDASGRVLVADADAVGVIRVDPSDGSQTLVASDPLFSVPDSVLVDADGTILVADDGFGGVLRYDPAAGSVLETFVGLLGVVRQMAFAPDGTLLVANADGPTVVRVDLGTGTSSIVTTGAAGFEPVGVAVEDSGQLVVTSHSQSRIVRVDPGTGAITDLWVGAPLDRPEQIAIVPTPVPACDNGVDDDVDGLVDLADPGCADALDTSEDGANECDDGLDNDGDGFVDFPLDPGCSAVNSGSESPACDDDLDNDNDGKIDWDGGPEAGAADPQCVGKPARNREKKGSCGLGAELLLLLPLWSLWRRRGRR
jgi:streptogramin lyase